MIKKRPSGAASLSGRKRLLSGYASTSICVLSFVWLLANTVPPQITWLPRACSISAAARGGVRVLSPPLASSLGPAAQAANSHSITTPHAVHVSRLFMRTLLTTNWDVDDNARKGDRATKCCFFKGAGWPASMFFVFCVFFFCLFFLFCF